MTGLINSVESMQVPRIPPTVLMLKALIKYGGKKGL